MGSNRLGMVETGCGCRDVGVNEDGCRGARLVDTGWALEELLGA